MDTRSNSVAKNVNAMLAVKSKLSNETSAEVRFDSGSRALYASEASNYRQAPIGVVIPKTIDDFTRTVDICAEYNVAMFPRGAGTSMCGQSVNAAICIDHSKYLNEIEHINAASETAVVQPGVICDQLKSAAAKFGLTFGPDPATHSRCTLGGMIGNNSCGAHSVMAGKTVENTERLEIYTATGAKFWVGATDTEAYERHMAAGGEQARIVKALKDLVDKYQSAIRSGFPGIKRRVSGFNLDQLLPENGFHIARALVGTEGTCANVLRAEMKLVHDKPERILLVLGFETIFDAADSVPALLPMEPIAMEGLDIGIVGGLKELGLRLDDIAELPQGEAWLMVEFGAEKSEDATHAARQAQAAVSQLPSRPSSRVIESKELMGRLWSIRETGASATSISNDPNSPDPVVGWEDAAVEPAQLGSYLREFSVLVESYGYKTNLYGHFGDGCVHSRITFDLKSNYGIEKWRQFLVEAANLVVKYGGSLSGEHGDGQAKGEFLPLMYSPELIQAFREFKAIWDPNALMNPGKLIDAMPVDSNLRMGPTYKRHHVETMFSFGEGPGAGFARETERCIGMGKCRSLQSGTMCPSFKGTREEAYSTRGRARLFFEMLNGELISDGWNDKTVKESLDLCLSCKGCKSDCPTHVDIPKYRSEFLYRYYKKNHRSLMDSVVGRIGEWLPMATKFSTVINPLMKSGVIRSIATNFGLSKSVSFPDVAAKTFRSGPVAINLMKDAENTNGKNRVLLWTDTFNNGFTPSVLSAAVELLEKYGSEPFILEKHVCCGRPLYDVGLLDEAKINLQEIVRQLAPVVKQGIPVLVLEPSCISVFRDEMLALLPGDELVKAVSESVVTLAEYLQRLNISFDTEEIYVHAHCHQRSCGGTGGEHSLGVTVMNNGCCGMAGAFGYHNKTAELAVKIGEMEVMPNVSKVPVEGVIVSDGFSCRNQIKKLSGREVLHLAEALLLKPDQL